MACRVRKFMSWRMCLLCVCLADKSQTGVTTMPTSDIGTLGMNNMNVSCATIPTNDVTTTNNGTMTTIDSCSYPQLYSEATQTCENFTDVTCGMRFEPISPCDYPNTNCTRSEPTLCTCESYPDLNFDTCHNMTDGDHAWPSRRWTPYYIRCTSHRTLPSRCATAPQSDINIFDFLNQECQYVYQFVNQAYSMSRSVSIPASLMTLVVTQPPETTVLLTEHSTIIETDSANLDVDKITKAILSSVPFTMTSVSPTKQTTVIETDSATLDVDEITKGTLRSAHVMTTPLHQVSPSELKPLLSDYSQASVIPTTTNTDTESTSSATVSVPYSSPNSGPETLSENELSQLLSTNLEPSEHTMSSDNLEIYMTTAHLLTDSIPQISKSMTVETILNMSYSSNELSTNTEYVLESRQIPQLSTTVSLTDTLTSFHSSSVELYETIIQPSSVLSATILFDTISTETHFITSELSQSFSQNSSFVATSNLPNTTLSLSSNSLNSSDKSMLSSSYSYVSFTPLSPSALSLETTSVVTLSLEQSSVLITEAFSGSLTPTLSASMSQVNTEMIDSVTLSSAETVNSSPTLLSPIALSTQASSFMSSDDRSSNQINSFEGFAPSIKTDESSKSEKVSAVSLSELDMNSMTVTSYIAGFPDTEITPLLLTNSVSSTLIMTATVSPYLFSSDVQFTRSMSCLISPCQETLSESFSGATSESSLSMSMYTATFKISDSQIIQTSTDEGITSLTDSYYQTPNPLALSSVLHVVTTSSSRISIMLTASKPQISISTPSTKFFTSSSSKVVQTESALYSTDSIKSVMSMYTTDEIIRSPFTNMSTLYSDVYSSFTDISISSNTHSKAKVQTIPPEVSSSIFIRPSATDLIDNDSVSYKPKTTHHVKSISTEPLSSSEILYFGTLNSDIAHTASHSISSVEYSSKEISTIRPTPKTRNVSGPKAASHETDVAITAGIGAGAGLLFVVVCVVIGCVIRNRRTSARNDLSKTRFSPELNTSEKL